MALWLCGSIVHQTLFLGLPKTEAMGTISVLALAANLTSVLLLLPYKDGDANVRSTWLYSRNDAIGNVIVMYVTADAVHLLAAGVWLGGLLPLGMVVVSSWAKQLSNDDAVLVLSRFSGMAYLAVAALVASGLLNGWFLVGSLSALIGTTYGELLLLKLGLFGLMLCLAASNRFWLVPALAKAATISQSGPRTREASPQHSCGANPWCSRRGNRQSAGNVISGDSRLMNFPNDAANRGGRFRAEARRAPSRPAATSVKIAVASSSAHRDMSKLAPARWFLHSGRAIS